MFSLKFRWQFLFSVSLWSVLNASAVYFRLLSVCILALAGISANAQNCTVNAGIDQNLCPGLPFTLTGIATGSFATDGAATWSQVSGPAVILGTPVISGNNINVPVTGYAAGNTYVFRLSAKCVDGSPIFQNVTFTTLIATTANAGPDISGCPGTQVLAGNAVVAGVESGVWTIQGSSLGVTIGTASSPTSNVTLPTTQAGTTTLRWTVTNPNGCNSFDQMTITNAGGQSPVTAPADVTISHCYTTTATTTLAQATGNTASYG